MYDRALKLLRQYHRLSQVDLANQIDISKSYLNEIEKGKKQPSLDILQKYADGFDIPISSLMLFAERSQGNNLENIRIYAADKVLKMLEWIAEDEDNEKEARPKIQPRST